MTDLPVQALSFVVTCKGRLEHLQQSLPRMAAQPGCECIVVDYDCPDGTADWVGQNYPQVRVVKVDQAPRFRVAHARNLGARAATSEWLAFIDADVLIEPRFAAELAGRLRHGRYLRPMPLTRETWGSFACHRGDFFALDGYDEILEGYGGEDSDLYFRLNNFGRTGDSFDARLLASLPHDNQMRSAHFEIQDIELSRLVNSSYNHIKYDLMRESGQHVLAAETRQAIYSEVKTTLVESWRRGKSASRITITLPTRHVIPVPDGWTIRRRWTFEIDRLAGNTLQPQ